MSYADTLDPEVQVDAEEAIAAYLFGEGYSSKPLPGYRLHEEECAQAGRDILKMILAKFRPDLTEDEEETVLPCDCVFLPSTTDPWERDRIAEGVCPRCGTSTAFSRPETKEED